MDLVLIATVAALASALTLYAGFGLGTLLLPAFVMFFPVPVAVAATGVVHLLNNLFKGTLLSAAVDWRSPASPHAETLLPSASRNRRKAHSRRRAAFAG